MTTVPAFVYLTRPTKVAKSSLDLAKDQLSDSSFEEYDSSDKYKWGIQPGVWWKDKNNWVMYDKKVAERIMKGEEIGVPKIKFNRSAAAYSQCISVNGPSGSHLWQLDKSTCPKRVSSSESGSSSDSIGAPEYEVDLIKMKEVHLESGRRRDIKISKVSMTGCLFRMLSTSNDSSTKIFIDFPKHSTMACKTFEGEKYTVSWKDDIEGWCLYNDNCQRAIWSAWTKQDHLVSIEIVTSEEKSKGTQNYIIDLKRMQQLNTVNGERKLIRIEMWISSSRFPHMWIRENCKYLTREIGDVSLAENEIMLHKLALSRLLCPQYVKSAILENMEPETLQSLNLNAQLDKVQNGHWNRFLESFTEKVKEMPDYLGHLWRFALNPNGHHHPNNPFTSRNGNGLWRFVFGAPSDGRDAHSSIKSRTSPSEYDTHLDWFGLSSAITEFHCKPVSPGIVSMLVFLVILPKKFCESREKVVFLNKVEDYLPVASITVRVDDSTFGPACSLWENEDGGRSPGSWETTWGPASSLWEDQNEKSLKSWSREGYEDPASSYLAGWRSSLVSRHYNE